MLVFLYWGGAAPQTPCFFPQHIVEGLLNSRRRVSDRPSWILISKTPARKPTNIIVIVVVVFVVCSPNKKKVYKGPKDQDVTWTLSRHESASYSS